MISPPGVIKAFVFGVLFVTVCCYKGMKTSGGAAGVGRATTQSVVTSYILILVSDFFLTMVLNMIHQELKYVWMTAMIRIRNLWKRYGTNDVLKGPESRCAIAEKSS